MTGHFQWHPLSEFSRDFAELRYLFTIFAKCAFSRNDSISPPPLFFPIKGQSRRRRPNEKMYAHSIFPETYLCFCNPLIPTRAYVHSSHTNTPGKFSDLICNLVSSANFWLGNFVVWSRKPLHGCTSESTSFCRKSRQRRGGETLFNFGLATT
jgi:hypothetical protein